jgi:hypothetical protein
MFNEICASHTHMFVTCERHRHKHRLLNRLSGPPAGVQTRLDVGLHQNLSAHTTIPSDRH